MARPRVPGELDRIALMLTRDLRERALAEVARYQEATGCRDYSLSALARDALDAYLVVLRQRAAAAERLAARQGRRRRVARRAGPAEAADGQGGEP